MQERLFPARQGVVTVALASLIAAAPAIGTAAPPGISLTLNGTGTGTVTSNPVGIDCPTTACQADFAASTAVTLTAAADSGSVFSGWNGACASAGLSAVCSLTITASTEYTQVGATFDLATTAHSLTVTNNNLGLGTVFSSPGAIDCGSTCSDAFTPPLEVTLTAVPEVGSALQSWGGDCSGDEPCTLQMDGPKNVQASFEASYFSPNPASSQVLSSEIRYSDIAWGDYDNDGDLDVVVVGSTSTGTASRTVLYRNDAGSFVDSGQTLKQLAGFATWGDYDNDGDLDLVIGGYDADTFGGLTQLYRNDGGTLNPVASAFEGVRGQEPAGRFADYDQDGDLDFVVAGQEDSLQLATRLYRNDGGTFVDANAGLTGSYTGELAWADYDNDGDLDLLVAGNLNTTLYENDNGTFLDTGAAIVDVVRASVDWADFDADGDLDLAILGSSTGGLTVRIYRNDGAGGFADVGAGLPSRYIGVVRWGDANGDGYPDLLVTGSDTTGDQIQTQLFLNNDFAVAGQFVEVQSGLPDIFRGHAEWGDYDNDGRLDVFLAGSYTQGSPSKDVTAALRNIAGTANVAPPAPTGLSATANGAQVELSWTAPAGDETPASGLTYNVRVGTTPGGRDVVAPMADPSSGHRLLPHLGNAGPNTTFTLKGVPPGTYYWAVQAIDASFAGSAFADGGSVVQPLQLSIGDASLEEGDCGTTDLVFTVTLTGASPGGVTVAYQTQDGSALAGQDYETKTGTLTFGAGSSSEEIRVPLNGDTALEPNETFTVTLASPAGAAMGDGTAVGTILNDDLALQPGEELVTWTNAVGVDVCGPDIKKTAVAKWGNAGASSAKAIDGDGYAEFTVPAGSGYAMFGLSDGDSDQSTADIDYAFYPYPVAGRILIYEKGVGKGVFGPYAAGDRLRVSVDSGVVTYWRNGELLYTSLASPTLPLRIDTSLYSNGGSVENATLSGDLVALGGLSVQPVTWTNGIGVSIAGANLTKTAATAWGNAGASSTMGIPDGTDGYAEFTVPSGAVYAMFGLANGDADQSFADIDYAFYPYPVTGTILIYEKGVGKGAFGPYSAGDTLRISVESGTVKYWRNAVLLYASSAGPAFPLRVDTSLYNAGATVLDAKLAGDVVDVTGPVSEAVAWTNTAGVSVAGGTLTKTAPTAWGNAGAASTRAIDSGSGYAEFTLSASSGSAMFGLSNGDSNQGYADIDYAFYTYAATGLLLVYEKGVGIGSVGSYAANDVLRITVDSGVVKYWRNGVLLRTSGTGAAYPLRVDTSLYANGATVNNARIAGTLVTLP